MTGDKTPGRRIDCPTSWFDSNILPGDFWKNEKGHWIVTAPMPRDDDGFLLIVDVSTWQIIEHEDNTITVSPSIFIGYGGYPNSPPEWAAKHTWHGFLEHGTWREA